MADDLLARAVRITDDLDAVPDTLPQEFSIAPQLVAEHDRGLPVQVHYVLTHTPTGVGLGSAATLAEALHVIASFQPPAGAVPAAGQSPAPAPQQYAAVTTS